MPIPQTEPPLTIDATTPEPALIAAAIAGHGAAFERLMRSHNQILFRTARAILGDDGQAEDAVQEGWLRVWRALPAFDGRSTLSTWLVRIVANEALGRRRRHSAEVIPLEAAMLSTDNQTRAALTEDTGRGPEQSALREQVRKLLETRIDRLPESFRTVFMLRAVEEMSVEDVALALEIPEATVRSRLFRARSLLREGLASEVDATLGEVFSFDGVRCDRIVAGVLARALDAGLRKT